MSVVSHERAPSMTATATTEAPAYRPQRRRRTRDGWSWLALPGLAVLVASFGSALWFVVHRSITDGGVENYRTIFAGQYLASILATFRGAALVTLVVLVLGYAYAYAMTVGPAALRYGLVAVLIAEFATSWLARAYAWQQLLQTNGIINDWLRSLGLIDQPLELMRNDLGMVIGTSHVLMPFMVLTLYTSLRQVDFTTLVAAQSMGARRSQAFLRVLVPATRTGIIAGCGLVFVLTLGFYVTPALLGDPSRQMVSALVVRRASQQGDFGVASALSVVLLVATLVILGITGLVARRFTKQAEEGSR